MEPSGAGNVCCRSRRRGMEPAAGFIRAARQLAASGKRHALYNGRRGRTMGIIYVEGIVKGPTGKQATVNFFVDSGATYTLVPWKVWQDIGLEPTDSVKCVLADGTEIERK